nr:reverse transcriptase domain-containing protein [Tanacetum cinerariifolium]
GRTGGRTGRGSGRIRGRTGDLGNGGIDEQGGQGNEVNDGVDGVPDFSTIIEQQLQNLLATILAQGDGRNFILNNGQMDCSYKKFLACNPKEYDGKERDIVYTSWTKKIESVQYMSRCRDDQKVKYTVGSFVGKALTWWNSQIHTRGQETAVAMEPMTIQKAMQKAGTLTDETIRNGSLKRNHERIRNGGEPSIDKNVNDDNKRTRTGNAFATTANQKPNCCPWSMLQMWCTDHFKAASRRLNQAHRLGGNRPNQDVANNGGQDRWNNENQARGRAFMLGIEKAH